MKHVIQEIELKYNPIPKMLRRRIKNSKEVYDTLIEKWNLDTIELYEEFKILLLNRANEILGIHTLAKGGINSCIVDIRLLFAVTIKSGATNIILAHNHPSGNLKPSEADKKLYQKVKYAAQNLDITLLDNMIVAKDGFYSFNDEGYL